MFDAPSTHRWTRLQNGVIQVLVMVTLWNIGQTIIFLPCGFFFLSSFFLLSFFFFSSPNLSGRRLDVCRTSTHGVALVRIYYAGLKRAARGSLKNTGRKKSPKNRHLRTIVQLCRAISSQLKHVSTIGKKTYSTAISPPDVLTMWWTSAY